MALQADLRPSPAGSHQRLAGLTLPTMNVRDPTCHTRGRKQLACNLVRAVLGGMRAAIRFSGKALQFLAASATTAPADDDLSSSIRGGILNNRTGKLDDGTDPAGIYNRD